MYNKKITGIVMKYEEEPSLFQKYIYWLTASGKLEKWKWNKIT